MHLQAGEAHGRRWRAVAQSSPSPLSRVHPEFIWAAARGSKGERSCDPGSRSPSRRSPGQKGIAVFAPDVSGAFLEAPSFAVGRYQVMFIFCLVLLQLLQTLSALPHSQRKLKVSKDAMKEVFTSAQQANSFIGRHLLSNVLEREIFNTDNLERECHEELCNYEEAREIFDDPEKMKTFWSEYASKNSGAKSDGQEAQEIDVILLLTGLIAMGVLLVIIGLLIYYLCKRKCPRRRPPRHTGCRLHNSSIFRRHEEFSLNPLSPCPEHTGLPTYEQAVALRGEYDAPPPPYPGLSGRFKAFKKSLSLPGP